MLELICFCFPAVISVSILSKLDKKLSIEKKIYNYFIYNLFINGISLLIISYLNNFEIQYVKAMFTIVFCLKYLLMAVILSVILPLVINYLKNSIKLKMKRVK